MLPLLMRAPASWVAANCWHLHTGRHYNEAGVLRCMACDTVFFNRLFVNVCCFLVGLSLGALTIAITS